MGAPTKYKEEYCQLLVDHMSVGLSYESFAGLISVCRDTLYEWEKVHKDFSYSKRIGREKMSLFFEKMGVSAMAGKVPGFNASTYIFTMKNKLGWTDRNEITHDVSSISINIDKDDEQL